MQVPYNIEAEQNILGLILNNNENLNKIGDILRAEYFYLPIHEQIYVAIVKLADKGLVSDPLTLKSYFSKESIFVDNQTDSYKYLLKIVTEARFNTDIYSLTKNIYDAYIRRQLININEEYILKARDTNIDLDGEEIVELLEQDIYNLASISNKENTCYSLTESMKKAVERIEKAKKNNKLVSGIDTGYKKLNEFTGGLQESDLIIIAGRPSMGKTALAINLTINMAKSFLKEAVDTKTKTKSVGFFSLEMSAEQLATRILSIETKINGSKIRVGKVDKNEFQNITQQIVNLSDIPIMIDDTPALTISAIRTRARRMQRQHNMGILIVDYLQLIHSGKGKENRVQEIAEVSQGLKAIAKELNIPVIAASQLSRAVESREDKRPLLSDLRESGNIEQDADIVMFIYREEYYLSRKIPSEERKLEEWQDKMDKVGNVAEIIVGKQRNGPVGNLSLRFDSSTTKFENLA